MNNAQGVYIETLTTEIYSAVTQIKGFADPNMQDRINFEAQAAIRKIISRECVDIAEQAPVNKSHHKKTGPKPMRFTIG